MSFDTKALHPQLSASAQKVLNDLQAGKFTLHDKLAPHLGKPLGEYLEERSKQKATLNNRYMDILLRVLAGNLQARGHAQVDALCAAFEQHPIMQHADHAALLLNQESFLNNFLTAIGHQKAGRHVMFSNQCTTISCLTRRLPPAGPTLLNTANEQYNVFSLSKRKLKESSFCALEGPLTFTVETMGAVDFAASGQHLLDAVIGKSFATAPQAYDAANAHIWGGIKNYTGVQRIGLDEDLSAQLASSHIETTGSPYRRILFDAPVRSAYLKVRDTFLQSDRNRALNDSATDFFWLADEGRLRPLKFAHVDGKGVLTARSGDNAKVIDLTPDAIMARLNAGALYPDLFGTYFIKFILPGAIAIGGTSQQDYCAHYIDIILETQKLCPFLDQGDVDVIVANRDVTSQFGGAALLELDAQGRGFIQTLSSQSDLESFFSSFMMRPTAETIGTFECASYLTESTQ